MATIASINASKAPGMKRTFLQLAILQESLWGRFVKEIAKMAFFILMGRIHTRHMYLFMPATASGRTLMA